MRAGTWTHIRPSWEASVLKRRRPLCGFSDESLRILLSAQEYPEGEFAQEIELEQ